MSNCTPTPVGVIYGMAGNCAACSPYINKRGCNCQQGNIITKQDVVGHEHVPVDGKMPYNVFRVINQTPYVIDNTDMVYGAKIVFSETVLTRVSRTQDMSCINLAATINMVNHITSNTNLTGNMLEMISMQYKQLKGKLPVGKQTVQFKVNYSVYDGSGGLVHQGSGDTYVKYSALHYTDIQDFFVNSYKGIIMTDIPTIGFIGPCTISIDTVNMYIVTIPNDGEENPYYAFNDDHDKIVMEHETIEGSTVGESVLVYSSEVGYTTTFTPNMSTRLTFRFTAFTGDCIWMWNTYNAYTALNRPLDSIVDDLLNTVESLTARIVELENKPATTEYTQNTSYKKGVLLYAEAGAVYQATQDFRSNDTAGNTVIESFKQDIADGNLVELHSLA